ncbi:uncharacterized protein LOC121397172 [Xenopus laevis]|uniref:Uncharacterized protein LOC121397172 n=1 Tax=Xenopus laevis TaxID=8355 RepID=A0A8J1LJT2_XENLA|nr:uncharacterized protein LOC121397172 [Xenopus laevis]
MVSCNLFTINVRSIKDQLRRQTVFAFLDSQACDLYMLQECAIPFSRSYKHLIRQWTHGPSYWSGGNSCKSAGVAILIRGGIFTVDSVLELVCGRLLVVDGSWAGEPVRLINVYASPVKGERLELFQTLRAQLATTRAVVLGGDFNCPIEEDGRSSSNGTKLDVTSKLLKEMVTEASLKDAVGSIGNGTVNYSWCRPDGSVRSRIDFVFTSRTIKQAGCSMVPCFFSDHRAIRFQGSLGCGFPRGPGSWKLNCDLLGREEVMGELRDAYITWRNEKCCFEHVSDWWEFLKVKLRCFFQVKGRRQACERRGNFKRLQRNLQSLQDLQRCGWEVRQDLEETKEGLKRHFEEESKRIIFRSKVETLEKGEKCNSFFFRKLHSGHTPLTELRNETGTLQSGKEGVMGVVTDYYSSLYAEKETDETSADKFLSELFAECIRRNPEIRGITAPGPSRSQIKCSLYMDDVTIFCADQPSVRALVQTCEDFGKASGAKVNCGKSETLLFGEWNLTSDAVPFSIKSDFIKILGVWFGGEGAALKCWDERMAKVRQKIGLWSLRDLTIEGKTLVLRNEILPVLQYMAQAWPPLATVCRAITRAVFHFIWGSKMDRVKRSVMYKEPRKGGKGVLDIPTLLRSFFVCNCIRQTITCKDKDSAGSSMSRFFLLPLWRVLGWDKWDSSYPFNWNTPWFYLDVTKFVREHHLEGVKPDLWKPKTIHKLIRARDEMESIPGLPEDTAKVVWGNVSSDRLTNKHKDIAWMAIQGGLPLRTFMHARNLCRYRHCPRCIIHEETSMHVFWDCRFTQVLLDALEHELRDCVPRNFLTHHAMLYGLFQGTHTEGAIQEAWRLMNSIKDVLWFSRNRLILRRERTGIQDCRRLIHSLLRDYNIRDSLEEEED